MRVLRDGAAIYATFCKRVVLRGNFVRDVAEVGPGYAASAYYLDEQAEDCVVEKNLAVNVTTPSHNHMAKHNLLRSNVFLNDGDLRLAFARCEDFTLDGNVIVAQGGLYVRGPQAVTAWTNNILHSATNRLLGEWLDDYQVREQRPLELPAGNDTSDPGLKVDDSGRVAVPPPATLPAAIASFNVSDAGPRP
jgi:hypothetical protein